MLRLLLAEFERSENEVEVKVEVMDEETSRSSRKVVRGVDGEMEQDGEDDVEGQGLTNNGSSPSLRLLNKEINQIRSNKDIQIYSDLSSESISRR